MVRFLLNNLNQRELLKTNIYWQCNEIFHFSIDIWFSFYSEWWDDIAWKCLRVPFNRFYYDILWCYDIFQIKNLNNWNDEKYKVKRLPLWFISKFTIENCDGKTSSYMEIVLSTREKLTWKWERTINKRCAWQTSSLLLLRLLLLLCI